MTDSTTRALPFGSWPSPISAADVARNARAFTFPFAANGDVWWQERRPEEKGRTTVVRLGADGRQRMLLPAPWDARSRVHEYGGRSYLPVPAAGTGGGQDGRAIVFANFTDQRLYLLAETDGAPEPRPLTPLPEQAEGGASLRYADFTLSPNGGQVWCVR